VATGTKGNFFNGPKYLTVSSQLHLEAMAQSMGNVWTLSPTFRAEHSDTSRHLSEFYMLEAEIAFVDDMDQVMSLIQRMLTHLARGLSQCNAWQELDSTRQTARNPTLTETFADLEDREVLRRRLNGLLVPERWPRITYTDAVTLLQAESGLFAKSLTWGEGLHSEHERFLASTLGFDGARDAYMPVFVTHYPRDIKAFYMLESDPQSAKGKTVDCFDLIVPGIGELLGGSMREHRLPKLIESLRHFGHSVDRKGRTGPGLDWYVDLRRWGSPPHGGFGLGFDRVLSYLTGVPSVRDLVAFPRVYGRADC
jgi:asparaginyl-tRNA synthetase